MILMKINKSSENIIICYYFKNVGLNQNYEQLFQDFKIQLSNYLSRSLISL